MVWGICDHLCLADFRLMETSAKKNTTSWRKRALDRFICNCRCSRCSCAWFPLVIPLLQSWCPKPSHQRCSLVEGGKHLVNMCLALSMTTMWWYIWCTARWWRLWWPTRLITTWSFSRCWIGKALRLGGWNSLQALDIPCKMMWKIMENYFQPLIALADCPQALSSL